MAAEIVAGGEYVFPSPVNLGRPISMVKTASETKRHYQVGNDGKRAPLHFRDRLPQNEAEEKIAVCK
jgi:hypothetical protein